MNQPPIPEPRHPVLLFDGVCNLCNASVQQVIRLDSARKFRFASLQSKVGRELLRRSGQKGEGPDSVVLYRDGKAFVKSDAVLEALRILGGFWRVFRIFGLLPVHWRDRLYDWVARNRYRWFGRKDQCMVPRPGIRDLFLDS